MSYNSVSDHREMLFDDVRNRQYRRAIESVVTEESVVLDLGAGVGLLGLLAAQAGAKQVYIVDPAPVVITALRTAKENHLEERVTVLEGRIEDLELPEKVDVITSVMTGNLLFCEDLLASLYHARDKYLKPDGVLIPDRARLHFRLVESEELYQKTVGVWDSPSQEIDFSSLQHFAANEIEWLWQGIPAYRSLSEEVHAVELDLSKSQQIACDVTHNIAIKEQGVGHGIILWLSIQLQGYWFETLPEKNITHWSAGYFSILDPLHFEVKDQVRVRLKRPEFGDWSWQLLFNDEFRTHSTFMANLQAQALAKRSQRASGAGLNQHGELKLQVLTLIQQGVANEAIARQVAEQYSSLPTFEMALNYVRDQALSYSKLTTDV